MRLKITPNLVTQIGSAILLSLATTLGQSQESNPVVESPETIAQLSIAQQKVVDHWQAAFRLLVLTRTERGHPRPKSHR